MLGKVPSSLGTSVSCTDTIHVTEGMDAQIHWFALEVPRDPLVEGSAGNRADTVSSSLWVQKGRGKV